MLRGTDVVGTTSEGSDNTVLGRCRGAGGVLGVEVGVGGFPINRGRFVGVDEDVEEG